MSMKNKRRFSRGMMAALGTAFVLGGLLALPQGAKASLIGDNIIVSTVTGFGGCIVASPCVDGDGTEANGLKVIDDTANPELRTGDGFSNFTNFFSGAGTFPTGSIDIRDSSILLTFTFAVDDPGFTGTFIFSSLDWVDDASATIQNVTCDPSEACGAPTLTSSVIIENILAHEFTVKIQCQVLLPGPVAGTCLNGQPGTFSTLLNITPTAHGVPVPEPSSLALFGVGLGMLGLMIMRRRRRQAA